MTDRWDWAKGDVEVTNARGRIIQKVNVRVQAKKLAKLLAAGK